MIAWIVNSLVFILTIILIIVGVVLGFAGIARAQIKFVLIGAACLMMAALSLTTFIIYVL